MGLLGDIYSAIDTKKRQVKGLLDDFGGTVDMGVRRFREDQQNLQNLFANAYPMAGDKTVLNSPQQIAQFQKEAADKAGEMGLAGATVWHGSPHKFDKFDSSKIGTGEGAQAYGHGLYLAESPEVATGYAKNIMGPTATPENVALKVMNAGNDPVQRLKQVFPKMTDSEVKAAVESAKGYQGNTYKVDLPDEHIAKMLDWDKPLSEQAPEVQKALQQHGIGGEAWGDITGPNLINQLGQRLDSKNTSEAASKALQQAGIPGIRYLDGGSRGTGGGTSNFVVFPGNEGLLSILERNGQPLK